MADHRPPATPVGGIFEELERAQTQAKEQHVEVLRLRSALAMITRNGCERHHHHGEGVGFYCYADGYSPTANEAVGLCCDPCIADRALNGTCDD